MNNFIKTMEKEFDKKANKFVGKGGLKYSNADEMAIDKIATKVWIFEVYTPALLEEFVEWAHDNQYAIDNELIKEYLNEK